MSDSNVDPNKLTVAQLLSTLAEHNVELPAVKQAKSFYVDLYNKEIVAKKNKNAGSTVQTSQSNQTTTVTTVSTTTASKRKIEVQSDSDSEQEREVAKRQRVEAKQPTTTAPTTTVEQSQVKPPQDQIENLSRARQQGIVQEISRQQQEAQASRSTTAAAPSQDFRRGRPSLPAYPARGIQSDLRRRQSAPMSQTLQPLTPPNLRYNNSPAPISPTGSTYSVATATSFASTARTAQHRTPICSFLLNLIIVCAWGLLFTLIYMLLYYKAPYQTSRLPYCDTEVEGIVLDYSDEDLIRYNCQRCPDFGYCAEGRLLRCNQGYVMKNALCLEDEEVTNAAVNVVELVQLHLATKAGKYVCGQVDMRGETLPALRAFVNQHKEQLEDFPEDKADSIFDKAISMMKNTRHFGISSETAEITQYENGTATSTTSEEVLYSEDAILPLSCKVMKKYEENKTYVWGSAVFLIFVIIVNILKRRADRERVQVAKILAHVIEYLKHSPYAVVHLRDTINERLGDDVDVLGLWPKVEAAVDRDSRIEVGIDNERKRFWEWKAPTSLVGTSGVDLNTEFEQAADAQ